MKKSNIIILHTDQHRKDCIGCYGNTQVNTPNINSIANDGIIYNNSYCSYPVCTPSRYSLLTGLHVNQHLGRSNHSTIPSGLDTIPSVLKENGYKTTAIGKMHFTPTYLDLGFDKMILSEQDGPGRLDDDYHSYLKDNNLVDSFDMIDQRSDCREYADDKYWDSYGTGTSDLPYEHHSTTWIGNNVVNEISNWDENDSNMMMVGFIKPHHPFDPPAPYDTMYDPAKLDPLEGWMDVKPEDDTVDQPYFHNEKDMDMQVYKNVLAKYYGCITAIDDQIGRILKTLKDKGLYDDTMIVFTSDHGEYMGYHHMILKGRRMYEPLMQVPLIIKYPNCDHKADSINNNLVENVDVSATILDYLGLDPIPFSTGNSLTTQPNREYAIAQDFYSTYMIRDNRYKLVVSDLEHHNCLYDLDKDKHETINRFHDDDYMEIKERLETELYKWLAFKSIAPTHTDEKAHTIGNRNCTPPEEMNRCDMDNYLKDNLKKNIF